MHSGTLCKANMAAACARSLCKVGWSLLEFPVARRPGILSYPLRNINSHGSGRTYGTVRTAVRTKLLSNLRGGRGRFLGCAFLLGGGFGLYQTVKFSAYQHLAEEESKVSYGRKQWIVLFISFSFILVLSFSFQSCCLNCLLKLT